MLFEKKAWVDGADVAFDQTRRWCNGVEQFRRVSRRYGSESRLAPEVLIATKYRWNRKKQFFINVKAVLKNEIFIQVEKFYFCFRQKSATNRTSASAPHEDLLFKNWFSYGKK